MVFDLIVMDTYLRISQKIKWLYSIVLYRVSKAVATHYLDCGNEVSISPGVTRGKGEVEIFLINEQREDNKGHNKVDATTDDSRKRHKPINCAVCFFCSVTFFFVCASFYAHKFAENMRKRKFTVDCTSCLASLFLTGHVVCHKYSDKQTYCSITIIL